jgi:hypothetical protein
MLDLSVMRQIVEESYVACVQQEYGDQGTSALKVVLDALPHIYARVEPELFPAGLTVFCRLPSVLSREEPEPQGAARVRGLVALVNSVFDGCVIEILGRDEYAVWQSDLFDLPGLSDSAIVYRYLQRREVFVVRGRDRPVLNPDPVHFSVFSRPTFSSLSDALEDYRDRLVRTCGCAHLQQIWADADRLFLKPRSEKVMRLSLHQHLARVLRDVEVRPEQVVDESHPVDIKVTWSLTNRLALIEIKWLGKSRGDAAITTTYSDSRAREGAQQLAEYLDANRSMTSAYVTRGYLVVIDARRRGLTENTTAVSLVDGMYYARREIDYDPEFHRIRSDFEVPIRMFAEPVCKAS